MTGQRRHPMRNRRRSRGIALVWTALLLAILLAVVGLSCDTAYVVFCEQQLQTTADASALAAAETLRTNPAGAVSEAQDVAAANYVGGQTMSLQNGDVVLGHYGLPTDPVPGFVPGIRLSTPSKSPHAAPPAPTADRCLSSSDPPSASAACRSHVKPLPSSASPPRAIMLDPTDEDVLSLTLTAGGSLNVGGTIAVNSTSPLAAVLSGNGSVNATSFQVAGGYQVTGNVSLPSNIQTGASAVADPLASLPEPGTGGVPTQTVQPGQTVLYPGYYQQGITLAGSKNYVLQPGLYIVGGSGFAFIGSGSVQGYNVTLFLTDSAGPLMLTGSGAVDFTPPTSGTYAGITVFQGRGNSNASQITGTAGLDLQGTIYMPTGQITMTGSGPCYCNALIVWRVVVLGSATVNIPTPTDASASGPPVLMQ